MGRLSMLGLWEFMCGLRVLLSGGSRVLRSGFTVSMLIREGFRVLGFQLLADLKCSGLLVFLKGFLVGRLVSLGFRAWGFAWV